MGHLGSDPELRYAPSGQPAANLSVATNHKYTNGEGKEFSVTIWLK
jgi:single-strand DNA-binding protein